MIGQSLQCIQCGKMENNFQCTDSDTGVSTECSSETTYCQNITTDRFTFKSCGIMDFGHEIDGQDECILDFVRNFRLTIINYTNSLVKADSFYTNLTNPNFQKIPIPHLTRPMKQKFLP